MAKRAYTLGTPYGTATTKLEQAAQEAKTANEQRYQQGLSIYDQIIQRYQPGGEFGKGAEALYEQGKTQSLARSMQNLVSSGLSNTTIAAGLPLQYEQQVGTPFRLQLEDMRMQALTQAELGKSGWIQAREDVYPNAALTSGLVQQTAAGGYGGGTGLGNFGSSLGSLDYGSPTVYSGTTGNNWTYGSQYSQSAMNNPYSIPEAAAKETTRASGDLTGTSYVQNGVTYTYDAKAGKYVPEGGGAEDNVVMYGTTIYGVKVRDDYGPITQSMVDEAKKKSGKSSSSTSSSGQLWQAGMAGY